LPLIFFTFYNKLILILSKPVDVVDMEKKINLLKLLLKGEICYMYNFHRKIVVEYEKIFYKSEKDFLFKYLKKLIKQKLPNFY